MRRRKEISDEELKENFKEFLRQMGEAAGLSFEEMEKLWRDFIESSRISVKREDVKNSLYKKRSYTMKITVQLNRDEARIFNVLKSKFHSKTNSEALRIIIKEAYKSLIAEKP